MADRLPPRFGQRQIGPRDPWRGPVTEDTDLLLSDGETRDGRRVWICSECGKRDVWGKDWQSFGRFEVVERVRCDECAREAKP